jgi:hypothetical protein
MCFEPVVNFASCRPLLETQNMRADDPLEDEGEGNNEDDQLLQGDEHVWPPQGEDVSTPALGLAFVVVGCLVIY